MLLQKGFITAFACFFSCLAFSQDSTVWSNIEIAIHAKKNLQTTKERLEGIKRNAERDNQPADLARSLCYSMLIDDLRTEDSLYFKNSAFIDSILSAPSASPILKELMHYMQAQRLWKFTKMYLRFNRARYEIKKLPYNYAAFTNQQLDSIIDYHFEEAKKNNAGNDFPATKILWLSSSPSVFLFKPKLDDIILEEQINFSTSQQALDVSKKRLSWLDMSQDDFIRTIDTITTHHPDLRSVFRLYRKWLSVHTEDPAVYYYIESLARKYVYDSYSYSADDNHDIERRYERYLQILVQSKFPEVKAHGIWQLCLLWNSWGSYCNPGYAKAYDTAFQYAPAKALQLYEENKNLFDHYPSLQARLEAIREDILSKKLIWKMEYSDLPGAPFPAQLEYKNVPHIFYRIIKISQKEILPAKRKDKIAYLLSKPGFKDVIESLPLPPDHNTHQTLLKIDPLPPGKYCLLYSDQNMSGDSTISFQAFNITNIALLHTDGRVYIVNRKSGMPLVGAEVAASFSKITYKGKIRHEEKEISAYKANSEGYFEPPKNEVYSLQIAYENDTITDRVDVDRKQTLESVYDKGDYNSLLDYYNEKITVQIFTDRGIYRPGQKVFYKAIFFTSDPKTGLPEILNEQNLKSEWFTDYLKKWISREKRMLYIRDPFGRSVDSVKVIPDNFGSVSGTFTIPKTAPTGRWQIEPGETDSYGSNRGNFRVEEYKRPTFELTTGKPAKTYNPGDTITFSIKVKSFTGAALNNTRIAYRVERRGTSEVRYSSDPLGQFFQLQDSVGYTDDKGELTIKVPDTALQRLAGSETKWNFAYRLQADATDVTGETHNISDVINVSTQPVSIQFPLAATYNVDDLRPVLISTRDLNDLPLSKIITVKVYRLHDQKHFETDLSNFADQWLYPVEKWKEWFPGIQFSPDTTEEKEELVFETDLNTGEFEKLRWPKEKLSPGKYKMVVTCTENAKITGEDERNFTLFDTHSKRLPETEPSFFHLPLTEVTAGDTIRLFSGSSYDSIYSIIQVKYCSLKSNKLQISYFFLERTRDAGITEWKWKIPADARNTVLISEIFVVNNILYEHEDRVNINTWQNNPQIIIEKFCSQLAPETTTTFSVSVKTKDKAVAAQLMSTIYDASLDKLEMHHWQLPYLQRNEKLENDWPESINNTVTDELEFPVKTDIEMQPVTNPLLALEGRVSGLFITNANGLSESQVIAYGTTTKRFMTGYLGSGVTVRIQGQNSLASLSQPLIILDGVPFTGDLSSINASEITQAMVLKDADATAIYGSRAANGVLIISTKGEIKLPVFKPEPKVKIRNNFNETAFFSPAIYADKDGFYNFTFTMPESVTEWNWKILAHTRKAEFAYEERKLTTQLPLMVQPNMPRLLCQGDHIILKSRISNLDTLSINGKISCRIEDAVTDEDVTGKILRNNENSFSLEKKLTASSSFELRIPEGQLHPLKIIIKAASQNFADGEEHIIPVVSTKVFVRQSVPFNFLQTDTLIQVPGLPSDASLYGIGLSINSKPQSALINALPFLANYSYDCAEQTFNKLLAYLTALKIMRTDTEAQSSYQLAKESTEKQKDTEQLPDELSEQTMPWLGLSGKTKMQEKQLLQLLDTVECKAKIHNYLEKLYKLQNMDGGLAWFDGGKSNEYISDYVLAGFGKLMQQGWSPDYDILDILYQKERFRKFITDLLNYADSQFSKNQTGNALYYCYTRSLWNTHPLPDTLLSQVKKYLTGKWKGNDLSLHNEALLIIASLKYFSVADSIHIKAIDEINNLYQLSVKDDNGIRWKSIADTDDLNNSTEETIALLSEVFSESGYAKEVNAGIIKWLLNIKTEHHWSTTKATAAVINLLQKEETNVTGPSQVIGADSLSVTDDLLRGSSYSFMQTTSSGLLLKKENPQIATGNITWYYFTAKPGSINPDVQLTKKLYLYNSSTKLWEPFNDSTELKIADKVKVVLIVETSKALRYVYIDDKRAAGFDPKDNSSGYEYGAGFSYYKSVRDAGYQFFSEFIPSGRSEISYEVIVSQEGIFINGPASLQCMYQPAVNAYSGIVKIKISK